ncbi:malectin domain-containing carbohydrate-binding protein [Nanoarchaeota archaeon]
MKKIILAMVLLLVVQAVAADVRINTGGPGYTDPSSNYWQQDAYYNTGRTYSTSASIENTDADKLYQSERWDSSSGSELKYTIPFDNGNHTVRLHFAEIWSKAFTPGIRLFDVSIEGEQVLDNYDIFNEAGARTAHVAEFETTVSDGNVEILFEHVLQNPKISAIEVIEGELEPEPEPEPEPMISITPDPINFPAIQTGQSSQVTVTIKNDGTGDLLVTRVDFSGSTDFTWDYQNDYNITPGNQVTFTGTFTPSGTGQKTGNLVVESNAGNHNIDVKGEGFDNTFQLRINSGGNTFTDSFGRQWLSDRNYNTGKKYSKSSPIDGTSDDYIYQTERYDTSSGSELEYKISVPNGDYIVNLHFAEIWSGAFMEGGRVFDVSVEEELVLEEYDIFEDVGARTATFKSFEVEVTDGQINILLEHVYQNPKISGIELISKQESSLAIDVWYGTQQFFGQLGEPQVWANVLGKVSGWIGSIGMSFSLNGGSSESLSIGPDIKRLPGTGDFNVELAYTDLNNGTNTVLLTATDDLTTLQELVSFEYSQGNTWTLPYSINWSTVTDIQDVAQVSDGLWELTADGVRTVEIGYDRMIAIGDISWTNYEVTVPITYHDVYFNDVYTMGGILTRWHGNTEDGKQPSVQYWPLGGIGSLRFTNQGDKSNATLHILEYDGKVEISSANEPRTIELGVPYMFKMRVETVGGDTLYKLKVWKASESEPSGWDLGTFGTIDSPDTGAITLLAHQVDATFGNINIVPI